MREFAEKTNSSKRMIHYYFGGKDELYQAVLERAYERIRRQEQVLRAIVGQNFDYPANIPSSCAW
jgi:AcrR family transcriptional regulator